MFIQIMFWIFYVLVPLILITWFVYRFVYKPLKNRPKKTEPKPETKTLVELMPSKEQLYFRPADPTASQAFESEPE